MKTTFYKGIEDIFQSTDYLFTDRTVVMTPLLSVDICTI